MIEISNQQHAAFGGALEPRVAAFIAALEAHRFTVDVPAPVEDPLVEQIARAGGMSAVTIQDAPPPPAPAEATPPTLESLQAQLAALQAQLAAFIQPG